ncbi:NEDD8-specific protease 1-like isoform X1 [Chenopodium quinoa]|nr:NEDD8-specific protease 1-like isoform X1 [Chenopodium quinoa]XP_021776509.1 NEDD8-specific protease 1-like isoform X1 [Chenopodium quinoa]XP_021776511.1 NEDD8-specific protease 1-like isoform X1 [Chenopodium quinoa]XP_021776512.1 NEDD8-specific protease 1-like isoform X1 [Chenopodium quinoa]
MCSHLVKIFCVNFQTMGRSTGDDMILSYNDVVLRRSDLDILSGPHFLNDRIIEFYFSYLSSCYPSDNILLVPPSISFWLQNCSDEDSYNAFVEPLNLPAKDLVIFPVNNNDDVTKAEAGSHWSLLVYYRTANVFVHHDSCRGLNHACSKKLYTSVAKFMVNLDSDVKYQEGQSSPQQQNGYDCGLFVAAIARTICSWYTSSERVNRERIWISDVKEQVTPTTVSKMRNEILSLIKELMSVS